MGIDWSPFQLKDETTKSDFEKMIIEQRRFLVDYWFESGSEMENDFYPPIDDYVVLAHSDELPQYVASIRIMPVANNPIFPVIWQSDLLTTCLPEQAKETVQKYLRWTHKSRNGEIPNTLKLRYLEQTRADLWETWNWVQECVRNVRNRTNRWAQKDSVIAMCNQMETLPPPQLPDEDFFVEECRTFFAVSPWNEADVPKNLDARLEEMEKIIQKYIAVCRDWNRAVKAEKCRSLAKSFDSFMEKANDPFLDEFFQWTTKWINRDYGMFLW